MSTLNSDQEREVIFLSGIDSNGIIAAESFWTWNRDTPASFGPTSHEAKWGAPSAASGAHVSVAFDPVSHWTPTEKAAFVGSLYLWSAVADITFDLSATASSAGILFQRGGDGLAETIRHSMVGGAVGTSQLGTIGHADISIDTSVPGFGPVGQGFDVAGGYPWQVILHEIGHAIGLGHAGTYDEGQTDFQPYTRYDDTAWSTMSYIAGNDPDFSGRVTPTVNYGNAPDGSFYVPQTVGPLDILAVERLYGMPVNSPLSGGQIFGFHSNIGGDLARYYDFSQNPHPIVTLWDAGDNNTLDLSGFTSGATFVDLHQGAFSTAGVNLAGNIAIAFGTRIDTYVGTAGQDNVVANNDGDVLMGGIGNDQLKGGSGNDHIYGNMQSTAKGTIDGADTIDAGDGTNYVNGNAGNDMIEAGWGTNRLYGGGGDDTIIIHGSGSGHINGNAGNDFIQVYGGLNDLHGGQGNDIFAPQGGTNYEFGDTGNDVLAGGPGIDVMTGGIGADLFALGAYGVTSSALSYDEVTDYADGIDKFEVPSTSYTPQTPDILHGDGRVFTDLATAQAYATALLEPTIRIDGKSVAALEVGSDAYLFFSFRGSPGDHVDSYAKVDNIDAASITQQDFVWALAPLGG